MGEKKSGCLPAYITQIKEKVAELSSRHRAFLKTEPLIAFRGESSDYGDTKLTPSLFRDSSYVAKESHLFELFCDYNIVDPKASNIEKAIETQHYASISRMLDISLRINLKVTYTPQNRYRWKMKSNLSLVVLIMN